jgi:hypothetical protein
MIPVGWYILRREIWVDRINVGVMDDLYTNAINHASLSCLCPFSNFNSKLLS